jgi:amino acid adenylation domain-containing protein
VHRDCLAVIDRRLRLTYGDLDGWTNGIARTLLDVAGEGSEPVALVFAQGAASCAAILGALKAGKPYVSLDPSDPRRAEATRAVGARAVLTDRAHSTAALSSSAGRELVVVDDVGPAVDPGVPTSADSIAYVFFTSGSTGEPKGVYDCHRNVLHNVLRYTNTLAISPSDRLSLIQAPSFSGCVSSLFSALLNGAAVVPISIDEDGLGATAAWLREQRVTVYHSVPSIFRSVLRDGAGLPGVRVVRLEGDRASAHDVELHRRHLVGSALVNGLGATETGLTRQLFVDPSTPIEPGVLPVGHPVRDVDVLVVGGDGAELPPGEAGEIVVRSRYLALGYWNRPDLTSRVFAGSGDERRYRTGDLGRLRADGCLELHGRKNGELEVLGHRVEPAEVEAELVRIQGVKEAVVATREGPRGVSRLVAYVVPELHAPTPSEIRSALGTRLPRHLIPSSVVLLEDLPCGPNGKVDRGALPDPVVRAHGRPPADDEERLVARIWEQVLDVALISAEDDFFDLGGDSLAAAEALAQLESETGRLLPLSIFAGSATVERFADSLRAPLPLGHSSLVVLRAEGSRAPIVLVHGNRGDSLHYASLVHRLVASRPLWALEDALPADDVGLAALAARHVATLETARPSGAFVLAGFCYGAALAHEIACALRRRGRDVELLALLGATPLEFPSLLDSRACERWRLAQEPRSFRSGVRHHLAEARRLPVRQSAGYVSRRGLNLLRRTPVLRRLWLERHPSANAVQAGIDGHSPEPYPGRLLLVLHEDDSSEYTDDPRRDWAGLATAGVDVELLPGSDHAMLEVSGVERLATLLEARLATSP